MAEPEKSGVGRIRGEGFSGAAFCLEVRDGGIVSLKRTPRPKVTPNRRPPPRAGRAMIPTYPARPWPSRDTYSVPGTRSKSASPSAACVDPIKRFLGCLAHGLVWILGGRCA